MSVGFGAYSTPPLVTNVATGLAEGILSPFPEHDDVVDESNKLTPIWRRWFAKQRSWLSDRGAYTPTDIAFTSMGSAAVSGTPVFQWWKQGNIVQVYYELQLSGVTSGGGSTKTKPMPFDPSNRILQAGALVGPTYVLAAMGFDGSVWTSLPCRIFNDKAAAGGTYLEFVNVPISTTILRANGTYITDN